MAKNMKSVSVSITPQKHLAIENWIAEMAIPPTRSAALNVILEAGMDSVIPKWRDTPVPAEPEVDERQIDIEDVAEGDASTDLPPNEWDEPKEEKAAKTTKKK